MTPPPDPRHPDGSPPPLRRAHPVRIAVLVAALLGVVLAVALRWALYTTGGAAALLARVPGLVVEAPQGTLLGGDFGARRIVWSGADGMRVELLEPQWRGLRWSIPGGTPPLAIRLDRLQARRVSVATGSGSSSAGGAPTDLSLPVALSVGRVEVAEIAVDALGDAPVTDVALGLALGDRGGLEHRITALSARWDRVHVTGDLGVGARAPLTLEASLAVAPAAAMQPDWRAHLAARGPLADLSVGAALRAVRAQADAAPALDVSAQVQPFSAWPLSALQAHARALDLSQFDAAAPRTALDADADVSTRGWDQDARVRLNLRNADAGRIDESRLPLREARLDLGGRPDASRRLDFHAFDIELGTAAAAAGRITGSGSINVSPSVDRLTLEMRLDDVQPQRLDARASALRLDGPVAVDIAPLTQPQRQATVRAELQTRMAALPRPGTLVLDVTAQADRIELREARAAVGDAVARLAGTANRRGDATWALAGRGSLDRFDPLPYWRGAAGSAWQQGPTRLDGTIEFDLAVPEKPLPDTARTDPLAALATVAGTAGLTLRDSRLVGVPVSGHATLTSRAPQAQIGAVLVADGNRVEVDARIATQASRSASDHASLVLQAPALAALRPLLRLATADGAAAPMLAGSVQLNATTDGRWPALATQGSAQLQGVRAGVGGAPVLVAGARATWNVGSSDSSPLTVDVQATGIDPGAGADARLDRLALQASGTWASHRIELQADAPLQAPSWVGDVAGRAPATPAAQAASAPPAPATPAPPSGSAARLALAGGLQGGPRAPTAWRGRLDTLELGASGRSAATPAWLRVQGVPAAVDFDAATRAPVGVAVEAGRADVLGAALSWSRLLWQRRADGDRVEAHATLEPLPVLPLLQKLQPHFGWGGDLTVQGSLDVRSAPTFQADVVVERAAGDLNVTDAALPDAPAQPLLLTDLRLGLVVRDGTWSFTQALAGRTLGNAAGAQVLRTDPRTAWPPADAPIEGVLQANVADLGAWGTWLPAGWRLGGTIDAGLTIGGRFLAPSYTGHVRGQSLAVRNLLEGVNVGDGVVDIALEGETARIQRMSARAGSGELAITGDVAFGAAPRANLQATAQRFQLLGRVDRRIVTSGQARLALTARSVDLRGRFDVDEGLIDFSRSDAPTLSDDVRVLRPEDAVETRTAAAPAASASKLDVALDLTVGLGEHMQVRGRGLDTRLSGELHLTAPGGKLAVNGTVRTEAGTYAAYGQKLDIERGEIVFSGPPDAPRLDILAIRPNLDERVGVAVIGSVQAPRVRLYSENAMSDIDRLSWLVLGRAGDEVGRTDTALLQRAAVALLAGEGGGPTDQITKALGLDSISLRQSEGEVSQTVVAVGKQLSRRWYVGYERSLNAAAGTWQLIYRVAQRFTLRAQGGADNSLDAIWTWRWQ